MQADRLRAGDRGAESSVAADNDGNVRRLNIKRGRREIIQVENQIANVAAVAADEEIICHARRRRDGEFGSQVNTVVAAIHLRERAAAAGVNRQPGVEVAAEGVHVEQAVHRRGELIPHAVAEGVHAIRHGVAVGTRARGGLRVGVVVARDDDRAAAQIVRDGVDDLERRVGAGRETVGVRDEAAELAAGIRELRVEERVAEIRRAGNQHVVALPKITLRITAARRDAERRRVAQQHDLAGRLRNDGRRHGRNIDGEQRVGTRHEADEVGDKHGIISALRGRDVVQREHGVRCAKNIRAVEIPLVAQRLRAGGRHGKRRRVVDRHGLVRGLRGDERRAQRGTFARAAGVVDCSDFICRQRAAVNRRLVNDAREHTQIRRERAARADEHRGRVVIQREARRGRGFLNAVHEKFGSVAIVSPGDVIPNAALRNGLGIDDDLVASPRDDKCKAVSITPITIVDA